ncbi:MAG: nucleotidyltransferase family protein [Gemmatimonadetes bacterium]|nr:nucleotidyltransferase family protein [Gemmatimonadota bacterium]
MRTAAIVLAAGVSRRMGTNKLLLEIDGEPLVRRAARRALEAGLSPVVVVLGDEPERVRAAMADLPCVFAANPHPGGPTSDSLHRGIGVLPEEVEAAVVVLADMVEVTVEMLRGVTEAAAGAEALVAASRYGDVVAPPVRFHRALFPEVLAFNGDGCVRAIVRRHAAETLLLSWPESALTDVDTAEDWARYRSRVEGAGDG